uniref:Chloride channel protein n=1 Tax=Sexangularia sp. CB-2014 TaxID=1486929 RepID=A0A7S1VEG5_9EUKA
MDLDESTVKRSRLLSTEFETMDWLETPRGSRVGGRPTDGASDTELDEDDGIPLVIGHSADTGTMHAGRHEGGATVGNDDLAPRHGLDRRTRWRRFRRKATRAAATAVRASTPGLFLIILGFTMGATALALDMATVYVGALSKSGWVWGAAAEASANLTAAESDVGADATPGVATDSLVGSLVPGGSAWPVQLLVILLVTNLLGMTATAVCQWGSEHAVGSGIPEMKAILSGVVVSRYLSSRTLLAKAVGLVAALGAGLTIGREGPYVHIACIVASQMMKRIPYFARSLNASDVMRHQLLAAACAVGVSVSFGATAGGVLFSIEVTSNFYLVENLWKGFFGATCAAIVVRLANGRGIVNFFTNHFDLLTHEPVELVYAAIVGISGGLVGALFVKLLKRLVNLVRDNRRLNTRTGQHVRVIAVTSLCAVAAFFIPALHGSSHCALSLLLSSESGCDRIPQATSDLTGNIGYLCIVTVAKFVLAVLSIGATYIPCGVYYPILVIGTAMGRLIGEVLALAGSVSDATPYAYMGAAAVAASGTHTVSTAIIVMELTGQIHLLLPILIASLCGWSVGVTLSRDSVYDVMMEQKGLPHMPSLGRTRLGARKTADVMEAPAAIFGPTPTMGDARAALATEAQRVPVVDTRHALMGTVRRADLKQFLSRPDIVDANDTEFVALVFSSREAADIKRLVDSGEEEGLAVAHLSTATILYVDPAPISVTQETPLQKLFFIFSMLGLSHCYVTNRGRLVGVVTKDELLLHTLS